VEVDELSPVPQHDLGAGIVLHPATVRYAQAHGLRDLDLISWPARCIRYLDRSGAIAHERPGRYRFTSYHTLYRLLLDALDPAQYHLGRELVGFDSGTNRVVARFADRHTVTCELLVCADGIQSTARRLLLPEVSAQYAGYVGWRGTVVDTGQHTFHTARSDHLLRDAAQSPARLPDSWHLGRTASGADELGLVPQRPGKPTIADLMTDRDGIARFVSLGPGQVQTRHQRQLRDTAGACLPPQLAALVSATGKPFSQAVFDIEVPRMAFGRVCLIQRERRRGNREGGRRRLETRRGCAQLRWGRRRGTAALGARAA
jgi:2,6-dihydroxypyridine 3-monooxygenase